MNLSFQLCLVAPLLVLCGCDRTPISDREVPGKYVAVGRVPRGGNGEDYFELNPNGTFRRYLKGENDATGSVTYGTWRRDQSGTQDDIVVDNFQWAPWQIPPGMSADWANKLRSRPGLFGGKLDQHKGTLRIMFMSDVGYWFEKTSS
jgi:hypothetical protein